MRAMALLLCVTPLVAPAQQRPRPGDGPASFQVAASHSDKTSLLSVDARDTAIDVLMQAIAEEFGTKLTGFDRIATIERVTVRMVERPSEIVIQWVLGAAGLRAILSPDGIHVIDDLQPFPDQAQVFDVAELTYLRALNRHPDHELAADGYMAQARIQESRENWAAAVNDYSMVIDYHPESPHLPLALLRSGQLLARVESWNAAAANFDVLAGLDHAHPYHVEARIRLAECLCFMGDPQKAIYTLDAIETYIRSEHFDPQGDGPSEKAQRLIVRSRALTLLGKSTEALRALDLALEYDSSETYRAEVLEMRGMALEKAGRNKDAAIAWMSLSELVEGEARAQAFAQAARLGLEGGDELGVLFIDKHARVQGAGAATAAYARRARHQLGLQTDPTSIDVGQTLLRAEELFTKGQMSEASKEFARVYERRELLDPKGLMRLALGYARALAADDLLDYAIMTLREIATNCPREDDRQAIYLLASELYEAADRIDSALQALRGEL